MRIGSKWDGNNNIFEIKNVTFIDGQTWIFYNNVSTGQQYSCLKEAFLQRFREIINNG